MRTVTDLREDGKRKAREKRKFSYHRYQKCCEMWLFKRNLDLENKSSVHNK